jgi:hypothetical protein
MSAKKINGDSSITGPVRQQRLTFSTNSIRIQKNGIEFHSAGPVPLWTEMTINLHSQLDRKKLHCSGVVVACSGTPAAGYTVSLLFTHLSRNAQTTLESLFSSRLN